MKIKFSKGELRVIAEVLKTLLILAFWAVLRLLNL